MKNKNTAQQGDVILKRINELPAGEKIKINKNPRGEMVLAEGETTGHYHGIFEKDSELFTIDNKVYLNLKEKATLTHQEHHHIELEAGIWEVGRVQEYDYFSKMVRPVAD